MAMLLSFLLIIFLPFLLSLITKKIKDSKHNLPPGPKKLPIIGNLHQLQGMLHRYLHDLAKKHGPVMHLRLGFVPMVIISSKEAAEEALKTHDHECCTRPNTVAARVFSRDNKNIGLGA
ncbi:Cytochrome P450 71B25 [Cardamine amara subsp. amara]|uniref:Cytochrome P450 71B25 n=1 Tax=Cardamine amara subsp. amara TaxID=228776 RepID=A0ABD0ZZB0_CARAN